MARKSVIPPLPPRFVVTPRIQKQYDEWMEYLKNMSSRIRVYNPYDEKINLQNFETVAKQFAHRDYDVADTILCDWPEKKNIAFIVGFDSSLPSAPKKEFLPGDTFIFCFGNVAFGLSYFEYDEMADRPINHYSYGLHNYTAEALSWKYITTIIQERLNDIEKMVPPVPQ